MQESTLLVLTLLGGPLIASPMLLEHVKDDGIPFEVSSVLSISLSASYALLRRLEAQCSVVQAFKWHQPTHAESMKWPPLSLLLAGLVWLRKARGVKGSSISDDFEKHVTATLPLSSPCAEPPSLSLMKMAPAC